MADVFVSYARTDKARVAPLVAAIEARGWSVWWDPDIAPGQAFDELIDSELAAAGAVIVVWTPTSVASRWVRGEAREAAERGILVPVRFDGARLPLDVRALHTTDLDDWGEDSAHPSVCECLDALATMVARSRAAQTLKDAMSAASPPCPCPPGEVPGTSAKGAAAAIARGNPAGVSICVLPFTNMSGDAEQEYFSDGITEDIITDLSKVSALAVASSNSAFRYKGKPAEIARVARELKVTHVLEGSVRKAGGRVRISAQLIDGATNNHLWAERYDRDASDIFAIQEEISQAIVKALRLRLLPEEKKAIERRGTNSAEAHDLYLMARQVYVTNQELDERSARAIIRMCTRATEIDPHYVQAWALMAIGHSLLRGVGVEADDGMAAANRALELAPDSSEAHAVKGFILLFAGAMEEAATEIAIALKLDPDSYEANRAAARLNYQLHRFDAAIPLYEKILSLMDTDVNSAMMLASSYIAVGDTAGTRRAAEMAYERAEAILARDQNNVGVIAYSANALAVMGEGERARSRMNRALLIDPDNFSARYNFACVLSVSLKDKEAALEMLDPLFATISDAFLPYAKADPDLEFLHDDLRYQAMVAAAEARIASTKAANTPSNPST